MYDGFMSHTGYRPEWAYHVTSYGYVEEIAQEGLVPSPQAGYGTVIFFSEHPILDYGEVPLRFLWPKDARARGWEWVTEQSIPPSDIEVFTGKEGREDVDEDWVQVVPALRAGLVRNNT